MYYTHTCSRLNFFIFKIFLKEIFGTFTKLVLSNSKINMVMSNVVYTRLREKRELKMDRVLLLQ